LNALPASFAYQSHDEQGTARFGEALAAALPERAVIALNGTLGAGKTRLVQALAEALGVDRRDVISPTFMLVQEYYGRRPIYHFDAYRLTSEDEFWALGPDEYFTAPGISIVEWAERVPGCLPQDRLEVAITVLGPSDRRFECRAYGAAYQAVLGSLLAWSETHAPHH
jgi:tRNA threonylcarbamoyladenosine biosynthesis protein TsaE